MKRSTERILTTHAGSLPRPRDLLQVLLDREDGLAVDSEELVARTRAAVVAAVKQQTSSGIDVVNDGEMGKISYATYVKERLTGFGGEGSLPRNADVLDFPEFAERFFAEDERSRRRAPACIGPVTLSDPDAVGRDIELLKAALAGVAVADAFITAASPGVVTRFCQNKFYPSHEAYLYAVADAMKAEYEAIVAAGFVLQVDCPDLATDRHSFFADAGIDEFRKHAALHVEALNHALASVPPDRVRLHLCWGNYEGPHRRDVPLAQIIDIVLQARSDGISLEACNPRHGHEWKVFEDLKLPEGKLLIPGVIDSTTNYIEHPDLVAERLLRYARLVGRENVLAGADCGFGTFAGRARVVPGIVWAKFEAMAEGARLASAALW